MAQEWQAKGNFQAAKDETRKALELEPGNAYAAIRMAQLDAATGDYNPALDKLEKVITADRTNLLALNWKGHILLALGRTQDALASYRSVTAQDKRNVWARLGEACCLLASGRDKEAVAALAEAKDCAGDDALAHRVLGETFLVMGLYVNARVELERTLELSPRDPAALCSAASVYLRLGQDGLAHNAWRQALALDATYDRARFGLLAALGRDAGQAVREGRIAEATRVWRTMLTYAPMNAQALDGLRKGSSKTRGQEKSP